MTKTNMTRSSTVQSTKQLALTQHTMTHLRHFIMQQLPQAPRLTDAASALHMSSRTLQRLLQQSGCCFRSLLNQCRHQLAQQYLCEDNLSLQQIAYQLGFEEQSSFQKAFKGWQGCSPGSFRQQRLPLSGGLKQLTVRKTPIQVNYGIN